MVCLSCDKIYHSKCSKNKNFKTFRSKLFCPSCIKINDIIRYNPFYDLLEEQNENIFDNEPGTCIIHQKHSRVIRNFRKLNSMIL